MSALLYCTASEQLRTSAMLMNGGETATGVNGYSKGRTKVKEEGTEMHGESSTSNQGKIMSVSTVNSCNTPVWLRGNLAL